MKSGSSTWSLNLPRSSHLPTVPVTTTCLSRGGIQPGPVRCATNQEDGDVNNPAIVLNTAGDECVCTQPGRMRWASLACASLHVSRPRTSAVLVHQVHGSSLATPLSTWPRSRDARHVFRVAGLQDGPYTAPQPRRSSSLSLSPRGYY